MKRVMILGCSGAGKSTFARKLGAIIGAPVVHLDTLWWNPGWTPSDPEAFRAKVSAALAGESWVVDGNHSRAFDVRAARADAIVYLDQPRWRCLLRVLKRIVASYGRTRPDMAPGCPEHLDWAFLKWVWDFHRVTQPRHEAMLVQCGVTDRVVRLRGDAAAADFLAKARRVAA